VEVEVEAEEDVPPARKLNKILIPYYMEEGNQ
jgi:hypothetical protein